MFGRCASQFSAQWVVQYDILFESKTILAESDLILESAVIEIGSSLGFRYTRTVRLSQQDWQGPILNPC